MLFTRFSRFLTALSFLLPYVFGLPTYQNATEWQVLTLNYFSQPEPFIDMVIPATSGLNFTLRRPGHPIVDVCHTKWQWSPNLRDLGKAYNIPIPAVKGWHQCQGSSELWFRVVALPYLGPLEVDVLESSVDKEFTVTKNTATIRVPIQPTPDRWNPTPTPDFAMVCWGLQTDGRRSCDMRFRIAWTEPLRLQPNMTIAKTLGMKVRANVTFPPSSETLHTDCTISVDIENPDVKMLDPSFPGTESSRLSERHVCVASWGCKGGFIPGISTRIVIPNLQCNSSTTDESIFAARAVLTAVGAKPGSTIWGDYIDEISDIGVYVFHSVHITKKDSSTGDVMNALTTASTHLKTQHNEPGNSKCGGGCSYVFNTPQNATTDGIVFQDCANDKCGFAGLLGT